MFENKPLMNSRYQNDKSTVLFNALGTLILHLVFVWRLCAPYPKIQSPPLTDRDELMFLIINQLVFSMTNERQQGCCTQ